MKISGIYFFNNQIVFFNDGLINFQILFQFANSYANPFIIPLLLDVNELICDCLPSLALIKKCFMVLHIILASYVSNVSVLFILEFYIII